jgi:alpha-tubulin suppressor-like RCC1 family protein
MFDVVGRLTGGGPAMTRRFLVLLVAIAAAAISTSVAPPTAPGAADAAVPIETTTRAAPSAPREVQAVAGNEKATLTWDAPTRGRAPSGYRVQRRTSNGRWVTVRDLRPSARRAVVRGLPNGQTARLRVAARSADGLGAYATTSVMLPLTLQITAGGSHTCALRADRTVVCFGDNQGGQLGDGTTTDRATPVLVRTASGGVLRRVRSIDAGGSTTCAVTEASEAWCWGLNDDGNQGNGTFVDIVTDAAPVLAASGSPLRDVVGVTVGDEHTCVWLEDSSARCMGANGDGELSRGVTSGEVAIPLAFLRAGTTLRGIVEMDAGDGFTCARLESGAVVCVGGNRDGQLGVGDLTPRLEPTPMFDAATSSTVSTARAVDTFDGHVCVVLADRTSRCAGRNEAGQLGNLTSVDASSLGLPLAPTDTGYFTPNDVIDIVTGDGHTCLIRRGGRMMCTGENGDGQLLTTTTTASTELQQAFLMPTLPLRGALSATAGGEHTCVRLGDGSVRCAGDNRAGQLGIGNPSTYESTLVRPIGL